MSATISGAAATPDLPELSADVAMADEGDWGTGDPGGLALAAADAAWRNLAPRRPAELSIVLTSDAAVRALNRDWRGIDRPTNVLSFPQDGAAVLAAGTGAPLHLGDIVLARETVLREAGDGALDPGHHIAHLVVHGVLHLVGYDHETDDAADAMERLETEILAGLAIADPHADAAPMTPSDQKDR